MNEQSIFITALGKQSDQERKVYLDEACGQDSALRAQVEELLACSVGAHSFLERPPAGLEATIETSLSSSDTVDTDQASGALPFLEPCDKPDRIGKLGPYEIIEVVGQGGMGSVLRAMDTKLSRVVAVKVMAPELAANPTAVKRFLREAKSAAAVVHDHVVTIHAIEDQSRPPYLVMEFVQGQTLQQKIDREGTLELRHILRIGSQMAAGLAAAHNTGLIHRDVKPGNILLENGVERVKITDFGLARAADDVEMTRQGMIAGTPQYMSPEQATGGQIDFRSDLFSLGSVLYTMCTGRPAFRAETTMGTLKRVIEEAPRSIREVNAEIPDWLEAIVFKLLAKNPDDRFQTAKKVGELLEQHLAHLQQPSTVPLPPPVEMPGAKSLASDLATNKRGRRLPGQLIIDHPVLGAVAILMLLASVIAATYMLTASWFGSSYAQVSLGTNDPNVQVYLVSDTGWNYRLKTNERTSLPPGKYSLEAYGGPGNDIDLISVDVAVPKGATSAPATHNYVKGRNDGKGIYLTLVERGRASINVQVVPREKFVVTRTGWTKLFNGRDLSGLKSKSPERWQVVDGILRGAAPTYVVSEELYRDFHCRAKVKLNANGLGSIAFRTQPGIHGEVPISGAAKKTPTGSLVLYSNSKSQTLHRAELRRLPPNEWVMIDIIVRGKHVVAKVDGQTTADQEMPGLPDEGRINLNIYDEGTVLEVAEFEIKELPTNPSAPAAAVAPFDANQAKVHQKTWGDYLAVPIDYTNAIGMKFRLIPPGEFTMGSSDDEIKALIEEGKAAGLLDWMVEEFKHEAPQQRATVKQPFYLGTHEVTRANFRQFIAATGYQTDGERTGDGGWAHFEGQWVRRPEHVWKARGMWALSDEQPVVQVSWNDAQAFCKWLSARDGRRYASPTEEQWEFAARAGTRRLYGGSELSSSLDTIAWTKRNMPADRIGGPQNVGLRVANAFGLYDMQGNVWEWCAQWQPGHDGERRVIRGGGWHTDPTRARPASRGGGEPNKPVDGAVGFRVAIVDDLTKTSPPVVPQPVKLHAFTPGKDKLPAALRPEGKEVVTVDGDTWRIENSGQGGNFHVVIGPVLDDVPPDGVLVFRAKVKMKAIHEMAWGSLGFGGADHRFISWDEWPDAQTRYDGKDTEWVQREAHHPVAECRKSDPSAIHLYAGLHADGVLWIKDVELLHLPTK